MWVVTRVYLSSNRLKKFPDKQYVFNFIIDKSGPVCVILVTKLEKDFIIGCLRPTLHLTTLCDTVRIDFGLPF